MKKNILGASIILFAICASLQVSAQTKPTTPIIKPVPVENCEQLTLAPKVNKVEDHKRQGYLSAEHALEISNSFYQMQAANAQALGRGKNDKEPTRAVWYSLEVLKEYISAIENSICKTGCSTEDLNVGIHFYFAKYPDDPRKLKEMGVEEKYAGRETIFLTATYRDGNKNIDFDPYQKSILATCKPKSLHQAILDSRASLMYNKVKGDNATGEDDPAPGVLNHGGTVPPPFGEGYFPSTPDKKD